MVQPESSITTFGRGYGIWKLISGSFVTLIILVIGIWLIYHSYYVETTKAVVDSADCTKSTTRPDKSNNYTSRTIDDCSLGVNYNINNKQYNDKINLQQSHKKGDIIDINYDPTDPSKASPYFNFSLWGKVALGVAAFGILCLVGIYMLMKYYPDIFAAWFAADMVGAVYNIGNNQ